MAKVQTFFLVMAVVLVASLSYGVWHAGLDPYRDLEELKTHLPKLERESSYVASSSCRSCHPGEYHSWHRTYHRTMTQVATADNVYGAFDGSKVISHGMEYTVFSTNGQFMVRMPDPDLVMAAALGQMNPAPGEIPQVDRRVVMATGSHHYQTYWVESPRMERLMQTLPLVYLIKDRKWIPREHAFMRPPDDKGDFITQWNHHCIRCHSTGGNPGLQPEGTAKAGMLLSEVGELGISCEACHGPGEAHIDFHRNPLNRYNRRGKGYNGDTIVNPSRLDHRRSSEVCGQCHGVYIDAGIEEERYRYDGIHYRPGEDISDYRYYIQHPANTGLDHHLTEFEKNPGFYADRWWEDGSILAGGREYTAMSVSGCYKNGEISCLSCHTMHSGDPADQLNPDLTEQQMCIQCHDGPEYTTEISSHTFHAPESSGSQCMNCHMPRTAYALFGALRSHQISSPSTASISRHNVPNACNLCHLDKTIDWTLDQLSERYGMERLKAPEPSKGVSGALYWLLSGDAKRRAIASWHFGWKDAQMVSGRSWMAPFLALTLRDPYGVVRYIAHQSLKTLPGMQDFDFDFLEDNEDRKASAHSALEKWLKVPDDADGKPAGSEVLIRSGREIDQSTLRTLLRNRDNSPVSISE